MIRKAFFWALLIAMVGVWAYGDTVFPPQTIHAETGRTIDGDTIIIEKQTFRLSGIDAPEYRQTCQDMRGKEWPCGKAARLHLASFVEAGSLTCEPRATDQYSRNIAECSSATVPDLGEAMVQAGLAISPAERGSAAYAQAEASAKAAKRGIWQGEFEAPALWRAAHPR
jgi:endonuclease YncB( thermonuclease family)